MENASRGFLDSVRKSMRQIRKTLGATRINPKLLTAAEHLQYEGYLRREQTNAAIMRSQRTVLRSRKSCAVLVIAAVWSDRCLRTTQRRFLVERKFVGDLSRMARRPMGCR